MVREAVVVIGFLRYLRDIRGDEAKPNIIVGKSALLLDSTKFLF